MILTEKAVTAAPLLKLVASGQHPTVAALAVAFERDDANVRKLVKGYEQAGWMAKDGPTPVLTDEGRELLAAIARFEDAPPAASADGEGLRDLAVERVHSNPDQPRKDFPEAELAELESSIRDKGVLQPILVRPSPVTAGDFEVVAGERRWRCAQRAGLGVIPALIRRLDDAQAFEAATVENVQRQDMTELEEANAFARIVRDRMAKDADLTLKAAKEVIAARLDKTVRYVELRLQLLQLPEAKQQALAAGDISVTDARKWLQSRPKLLNLTPAQWLIALEVYDAQERAASAENTSYAYAACQQSAENDPDAQALSDLDMLSEPRENYGGPRGVLTGHWRIRLHDHQLAQLRMKFAIDVAEEDLRMQALDAVRTEVKGWQKDITPSEMRAAWPAGLYVTPWLNGPFGPSQARAAEIAAELAALDRQDEERRQAQAKAQAERAAQVEAGRGRLAAAQDVVGTLNEFPPIAGVPEIADLLADGGKPLPWFPTPLAGIVAANGEAVLHDWPADRPPLPDTVARMVLIAAAVNALAGLATPSEPSGQVQAAIEAQADLDVGESLPDHAEPGGADDGAPETDGDEETAGASEDAPIPPYLRRLAGGFDAANP